MTGNNGRKRIIGSSDCHRARCGICCRQYLVAAQNMATQADIRRKNSSLKTGCHHGFHTSAPEITRERTGKSGRK
ncbi:hypothetical protein ASA_2207 [Aeromonas salmonicida subsp. salmonicida A449]|uniref:Uncharacterized protein n=1 Tax=Aeromonas salmonicida (strain A449) TaxID=382245 RepID=A4SMZ7_AERS4|nr:hypothetical protein ASA_2207 [Aeromonas salmonicida subsp. salmonicida A449]